MRVWIIGSKRYGEHDEEQFEVEWQTTHPKWATMTDDERSDFDLANHPFHYAEFPIAPGRDRAERKRNEERAKKVAVAHAQKVAADAFWGLARVTKQHLEKVDGSAWDWENGASEDVENQEAFNKAMG